jgi:hypothetical protein
MKNILRRKQTELDKPKPQYTPGPCLNCGTYLGGNDQFCSQCGQKQLGKEDLSFRHIIGESFFDYFHFDSKFFRTLFPLMYKPGFLTQEYMKGKRKSYVEPFRLFLVISVIYFLLLPLGRNAAGERDPVDKTQPANVTGNAHLKKSFSYNLKGKLISAAGQDSIRREIDTVGIKHYVDKEFAKDGWVIKLLMKQSLKLLIYSGESFTTVLEHTASKMIFLLIPFFAMLLKLFSMRSKRLYYEHLIFSLHIHAFVFTLLIIAFLIEFLVPVRMSIIIVISLVYLFFALKRNYGFSTGKSLRKLLLIMLFYCIIALPVFFILLILVAVIMV